MRKGGETLPVTDTLQDVVNATTRVKYVPHAPRGGWLPFLQWCGDTDAWDVSTFLRALVAYTLGKPATPLVISMFHDNCEDATPSYRVICYDVSYDQLMSLDALMQPSWCNITINPENDLFTVTLTPTRSLMKLIYKQVIE